MQFSFNGEMLAIETKEYASGATAVVVTDMQGAPFATISVNTPVSNDLFPGDFYVKHYSENEAIVAKLIELGILVARTGYAPYKTGFVSLNVYSLNDPH